MGYYGIDVSYAQPTVDWASVFPVVDFVIIRAGYGQGTEDNMLASHIQGCEDNNLLIPAFYWFSYALNVNMARQEADYAFGTISQYNLNPANYVLWYDWEDDSDDWAEQQGVTITNADRVAFAEAFCNRAIELGFKASGIYSNPNYLQNMGMQQVVDDGYPLWLAQWSVQAPSQTCSVWQYGITQIPVTYGTSSFDGDYIGDDYPDPINPPIKKKKKMPLWMYLRYLP